MIAFLAIVAALTALALLLSAVSALAEARAHDGGVAGPWGLLARSGDAQRTMSAEERRWQTLLLRAEDDEGTWRDLLARLAELERTLGGEPQGAGSADFDRSEVRATIARLEVLTERKGEPA